MVTKAPPRDGREPRVRDGGGIADSRVHLGRTGVEELVRECLADATVGTGHQGCRTRLLPARIDFLAAAGR